MAGRARNTAGSPATIFYRKGSYRLQITNIRNSSQTLAAILQLSKKRLADMHTHRVGSRQTFSDVPLIEFTLNRNHLVDADLPIIIAFVQESPHIQSLELFGNMLTDVSTALLAGFLSKTNLQRLKIGDNLFTATGAVTLAQGLTGANSRLVQLHVGGNSLGGRGVEAVCDACHSNHIESLGLRDIDFDTSGWLAIGKATACSTAHITELQLKGNRMSEAALDALLQGAASMRELSSPCCRLTNIAVNNCELTPQLMKPLVGWLSQASQLSTVDIRHNPIHDEGIALLFDLIEAQSTDLPEDHEGLSLMVAHCGLTKVACEYLGTKPSILKRLTNFDVGFNPLGEEAAVPLAAVINASPRLDKIHMHHCSFAGESILHLGSVLASHPGVKDVDFSCNYTRSVVEGWCAVVEKAVSLEQLSLTDNEITAKGLSDIALALSKRASPTLVSLQLGGQSKVPPLANAKNLPAQSTVGELLNRNRAVHDSRWGAKETVSVRPPAPQTMYPPPMPMVPMGMMPFGSSPHNAMGQMPFGFSPHVLPMGGYPNSVLGTPNQLMMGNPPTMSSSGGYGGPDPVMSLQQGGYIPHLQQQALMFGNQQGGLQQGMQQGMGGMGQGMGQQQGLSGMGQGMQQGMGGMGQGMQQGGLQQGMGQQQQGMQQGMGPQNTQQDYYNNMMMSPPMNQNQNTPMAQGMSSHQGMTNSPMVQIGGQAQSQPNTPSLTVGHTMGHPLNQHHGNQLNQNQGHSITVGQGGIANAMGHQMSPPLVNASLTVGGHMGPIGQGMPGQMNQGPTSIQNSLSQGLNHNIGSQGMNRGLF